MSDGVTRVILVGGHVFSRGAFEGILASAEILEGRIEIPLMIGLHSEHAPRTVGYWSCDEIAARHHIPCVMTRDGTLTSLISFIRSAEPHYMLVIGWSRLVAPQVLAIPGAGSQSCIGMHPSPLPIGRGQAPIPWTIIKGLSASALSVFFLADGADTGPIIAQYPFEVRKRETSASLFYRVGHLHFLAGTKLAMGLAERRISARSQDDSIATRWPRRRASDGEITPAMTRQEVDAIVRALHDPYPRPFIVLAGRRHEVVGMRTAPRPRNDHKMSVPLMEVPFDCCDGLVTLLVHRDRSLVN